MTNYCKLKNVAVSVKQNVIFLAVLSVQNIFCHFKSLKVVSYNLLFANVGNQKLMEGQQKRWCQIVQKTK